jgi:multimeric flavodoxin WrbA
VNPDKREPRVVKGDQDFTLDRETFRKRWLERAYDPAFESISSEVERVIDVAWSAYQKSKKSPRTQPAGPEFADPAFPLPVEWLDARRQMIEAQRRHDDAATPSRILVVHGSARTDQTCPGEISKTYRLATISRDAIAKEPGFEVDFLDMSRLTAEANLVIYPCKACVSTAQPLCHWPCSCYPNHALGQVNDWMNEIYPKWVAAHGVMILCPVNWYQAPSVLKLMIDRLVCADGGNPDPTTTRGKDPARAVPQAPLGARLLGRGSRRCRGRRESAPHARRLDDRHGDDPGGTGRGHRPLRGLLRALRHESRRSRPRHGVPGRDTQRGPGAGGDGAPDSFRSVQAPRRPPRGSPEEVSPEDRIESAAW